MPTQPQPTLPTVDFSDRPLLCHPQDPFAAERATLLAEIKEKEEFAQKTTDLCEAQDVRILNLEKVSRPWRFFWGGIIPCFARLFRANIWAALAGFRPALCEEADTL